MIDRTSAATDGYLRSRFLLYENPIAGLARRTLTDDVVDVLQRRGASVTRLPSAAHPAPSDWREWARQFDAIICAGGDGTVRHLANRIEGLPLPIGLIPRGTGNVLAEEIGLPRKPAPIAETLLRGPVVNITGALANDEPFYLMAGVGFDAEAVRRLDLELKRKWGKPAYTRPVIAALAVPEPHLTVRADGGREAEAGWVLVANARRYAGAFKLSAEAGLHRPGLIAYLMPRGPLPRRLANVLALGLGALQRIPGIKIWPVSELTVTSIFPAAVQVDGDALGTVPLTIKWGGVRLPLIVPQTYADNLLPLDREGRRAST